MEPLALLIALIVMVAVTLLVIGVTQYGGAGQRRLARRLEYLGQGGAPAAGRADSLVRANSLLKAADHSKLGPLAGLLAGSRQVTSTTLELERAGIPLRVGEYVTIRLALAAVLFLVVFILAHNLLIALPMLLVGYLLPRWYVGFRRRSRQAKINQQLVEMLNLVSNSLKSGYGLLQSFEFAARQLSPPLASELKRMLQEANLGAGAEPAFEGLAERINTADMELVITAINIQRTVGGNLAQVLDSVSYTMRERERIRGEVKTLTSQQRLTGMVISALPILMGLVFFALNPDYMTPLFTATVGKVLLLGAAGAEVVGIVLLRALVAFEV